MRPLDTDHRPGEAAPRFTLALPGFLDLELRTRAEVERKTRSEVVRDLIAFALVNRPPTDSPRFTR